MLERFRAYLFEEIGIQREDSVLLAVSGGIDSVCMVYLFKQLDHPIGIAHFNHGLRNKESDDEESFVQNLANQFNLPFYSKKEDISSLKGNMHKNARKFRYQFFQSTATEYSYKYIATAHHKDDELENLIQRLHRGSGIKGLSGIPHKRNNIIRPMLFTDRNEILEFSLKHKIEYREDSSNLSPKYQRNKVRNLIIPYIEEQLPGFEKAAKLSISNLKESGKFILEQRDRIQSKLMFFNGEFWEIKFKKLSKYQNPAYILLLLIESYGFNRSQIEDIIRAKKGAETFSKSHKLLKGAKTLALMPIKQSIVPEAIYINQTNAKFALGKNKFLTINDHLKDNFKENRNGIIVDKNKINFPLFVRQRKPGDLFYPRGMKMKSKKLKKLLIDLKMDRWEKDKVQLLCNKNGDIIWVIGIRQDERFLANKETEDLLFFQLSKLD